MPALLMRISTRPKCSECGFRQGRYVRFLGDITYVRETSKAAFGKFAHSGFQPLLAARGQDNFRSGFGQPLRRFFPESA